MGFEHLKYKQRVENIKCYVSAVLLKTDTNRLETNTIWSYDIDKHLRKQYTRIYRQTLTDKNSHKNTNLVIIALKGSVVCLNVHSGSHYPLLHKSLLIEAEVEEECQNEHCYQ